MKRNYLLEKSYFFCLPLLIAIALKAQVPATWTTANSQLVPKLISINSDAISKWDGKPYCTSFSGNILEANSNRGYSLFSATPPSLPDANYQNILLSKIDTMLMAFDTLGFKAVDITINYPVLVNTFPNNKNYLSFFKRVYQLVHKHGMKVIEGCQATFVDPTFGEQYLSNDVRNYLFNPDGNPNTNDSLTVTRYKNEKLQMMQTIIDSLAPDYLTLEMEPQTQQANLFNLVNFATDSVLSYVNYFTSSLKKKNTILGAGAGTWNTLNYFGKFATTDIDYLDYHVYPVNQGCVDNIVFQIDSIADKYNKKLVVGEAWCYKSTDNDIKNGTSPAVLYSRDPFDYWDEVDTLFIKTMISLSQQSKIETVSFFWSIYMFGHLTYNSTYSTYTSSQLLKAGQHYAYDRMNKFQLDAVGKYGKKAIAKVCSISTSIQDEVGQPAKPELFPNPAKDQFTVQLPQTNFDLSISDMMGQKIYGQKCINNKANVNCSNLPAGIYFVHAVSDMKQVYVDKIIIGR